MCRGSRILQSFLFVVVLCVWFPVANAGRVQAGLPRKIAQVAGISEYRFDNGLRLLLCADGSRPLVTVNMTVLVGSRHEGAGEGGMAHLLEHMLFKGTPTHRNIPAMLRARGAKFNATTNIDRTRYFETLPAGEKNLAFALKLEADRLVNSLIRKSDLDSEMTVVRNEFEIARNSSARVLYEAMTAAAFQWHNYGKPTIGNQSDIERVPIEKLRRFYRTYYRPDNVVLIIAGKFQESRILSLVAATFGRLPLPRLRLPKTYTVEPTQQGIRTVTVKKKFGSTAVGMLFHVPAAAHADSAPLAVLRDVLTVRPTGPLYAALVKRGLARSIKGTLTRSHDPGFLLLTATATSLRSVIPIRTEMAKVIQRLAVKPSLPSSKPGLPVRAKKPLRFRDPLQRLVDFSRLRFRNHLEGLMSDPVKLVDQLSHWSAAGDWRLLFLQYNRIEKVTAADVRRVVGSYLKRDNRTLGFFLRTASPDYAKIPATPDIAALVKNVRFGSIVSRGEVFLPLWANLRARTRFTRLPEGLKVALLPRKTSGEKVTLGVMLRYGNRKSLKGIWADFIPEYMLMGTKRLSQHELRRAFALINSSLSANGGAGSMIFTLRSDRRHFQQALELFKQVLREPALPESELSKLKIKYFRRIRARRPSLLRVDQLLSPKYADDDPRHFPAGSPGIARYRSMGQKHVREIVDNLLGAHAGELIVVGDFDPDQTLVRLKEIFRGWKGKRPYAPLLLENTARVQGASQVLRRSGLTNAYYDAGLVVPVRRTHDDNTVLMLATGIANARIRNRIREKEGFSYRVLCQLRLRVHDDAGRFRIAATCNPASIAKLENAVREELQRLHKQGVSLQEFRSAQSSYLQKWNASRTSIASQVSLLGFALTIGRDWSYYQNFEQRLRQMKAEDVNAAFRKYFDPKKLVVVTFGDIPALKPTAKRKPIPAKSAR